MAVAMIYWHLAPRSEVGRVVKPLVRLLGVHREIDYAVLANIATMAAERPVRYGRVADRRRGANAPGAAHAAVLPKSKRAPGGGPTLAAR